MRDTPTNSGASSAAKRGSSLNSVKLCSKFLPKSKSRIERDGIARDARLHACAAFVRQKLHHLGHHVIIVRTVLHRTRLTLHMHETHARLRLGRDRARSRLAQGINIVDDAGAGRHGRAS